MGDESSQSISALVTPGGIVFSESEKIKALADSFEGQFQPVTIPSIPAVIEMFDVSLESYLQTPASEPKLTKSDEVLEAIRGLKVGKAPGPNGITNRAISIYPCGRYSDSSKSSMLPINLLQVGSTLG